MNEEIKNAMVELENWLSDPQELGKKPIKIEYANSFEDEDGIRCIIFKYKKILNKMFRIYGASSGDRTRDTLIKSQVLYQLS